ncbi:DEAD/DEAH box helicase family protein [Mediterraneibacter glycyrrhizinilyticus]|nr:DEAD/DEAH box helicase family protein [Mediterraneibacter glycyrrhizinilyticus]
MPENQDNKKDAENAASEETAEQQEVPDLSQYPITRRGDDITIGTGNATHVIDITVSEEEYKAIKQAIPEEPAYNPASPPYHMGDTVYLDNQEYRITELRENTVQLLPNGVAYPVFRAESRERFEGLLRQDSRNGAVTEYLAPNPSNVDQDLLEVLATGLLSAQDKEYISGWLRDGEGNTRIAQRLSELFANRAETMELATGDTADFRTYTTGIEVEILDSEERRLAALGGSWGDMAPIFRGLYIHEQEGFYQNPEGYRQKQTVLEGQPSYQVGDSVFLPAPDQPISGTLGYVGDTTVRIDTGPYSWSNKVMGRSQFEELLRQDERNASLFVQEEKESSTPELPELTTEPETIYPAEQNELPYDIVVERLRINEAERPEPEPVAVNFRITDEHLGEGGPKQKFRANIMAIQLLKKCEEENRPATPDEQKILSGYVGWGGLADAFDERKGNWATEYLELKTVLTPEEYTAARASTLNAHYTSPTVIHAIYDAVEQMGFRQGNILEPSMGVGNFFGLLPESMQQSRLYGVELDSISGRIAKKLYPNAEITVAGFETTDRRDFYDLAVGNVPFGDYKVNDKPYNKLGFSIHNYFFAKALDQVRPGGVVAFVTSRYTMDAKSPEVRKYLAQRAELLGAIRLPNNAFRANAGTDVVSDILFLQKREHPIDLDADWIHLGRNENGLTLNSYFVEHPEMVLGRLSTESTQYGKEECTVLPIDGADLSEQLKDAISHIHGEYVAQERENPELEDNASVLPADPTVKNFSYTVVDGEVYFRENSIMSPVDLNDTVKGRVKGMVELRQIVNDLIEYQLEDYPQEAIEAKQQELNTAYDAFTQKYGLINSRGNEKAFSEDSSYYLLCSLENIDEDGNLESKADIFTKRTIRPERHVTHVDTPSEALAVSIGERGKVDIPFMAELLGKADDFEAVTGELTGVIFRDPMAPEAPELGWQTADEYLSGNVRDKLRIARLAAQTDPQYTVNVAALEKAQPKDLEASEIEVRLGATWIDPKYIQQFMEETFETPFYLRRAIEVKFSTITAEWQISGKSSTGRHDVAAYVTYGTDRANAYKILEDTLNLKDARIYDTIEDAEGNKKRVLNKKETTLAQQKQQAIKDAFRDWIWRDPKRRETLVAKYNELFNSTRPREYDGSHIHFVGMNPDIKLRPHQRNAIAHVLYGGNTLLAHEVGAGKTFEMAASAMESKRLGLCQKSMFVVPNHLTQQWANEFLRLYPSAKLLVTTKKDFETAKRKKFCARIASGDYDAIIIGHSQFEKIPISAERQERLLQEQIDDVTEALDELKRSRGENFTIKQMEKTRKSLQARLDKLLNTDRKDDVITFEQLGVDRLFVDESQAYKNLFLYTKMRNVAGLSTSEAQRSSDMFMKCRYLDEVTGGRGVVFASGTPVSNSMTELYTVMRYLQYNTLQQKGLTHFDCWASTFGESTTAIELAPEGAGYRARTRFAKFFNLPELMNLFKEVADIKTSDQLNLPVPEAKFETVVVQPSEIQKEMVAALSERAAAVHSGQVDPSQDNMLKITSDGRKIGLDQRLMNPLLPDDPNSKLNACVGNVFRIWEEGKESRLTQLLFCDMSTPKDDGTFNVYDDIKAKLIARGVPAEEIAFIHDADNEVKKKELFAKVRTGQVRVLLGSTQKMGSGTNCQDLLVAVHHLDVGWRPSDMTQRNGRIIRQGNRNKEVQIYQYVTEGTFDAYLYQTLENKQKFISQIMTSKSPVRACDDVDEQALSYAEIKALCAGDSRIKEKMDLDIDVARLKVLKSDHQSQQYRLEDRLLKYFPAEMEKQRGFIQGFEADMQTVTAHPLPKEGFVGAEIQGRTFSEKELAGEAILAACKSYTGMEPVALGTYRGFSMELSYNSLSQEYEIALKGSMTHTVTLGTDARGNFTRMDNTLAGLEGRKEKAQVQLENLHNQQEAAKAELGKPFPQEAELAEKSARLAELDAALNMDNHGIEEEVTEPEGRSSVLADLKAKAAIVGEAPKRHTEQEEVR